MTSATPIATHSSPLMASEFRLPTAEFPERLRQACALAELARLLRRGRQLLFRDRLPFLDAEVFPQRAGLLDRLRNELLSHGRGSYNFGSRGSRRKRSPMSRVLPTRPCPSGAGGRMPSMPASPPPPPARLGGGPIGAGGGPLGPGGGGPPGGPRDGNPPGPGGPSGPGPRAPGPGIAPGPPRVASASDIARPSAAMARPM